MLSRRRRPVEFPPHPLSRPRLSRKVASVTRASFNAIRFSALPAFPLSRSRKSKLSWPARDILITAKAAIPPASTLATAFPTPLPSLRASPYFSRARTSVRPTSNPRWSSSSSPSDVKKVQVFLDYAKSFCYGTWQVRVRNFSRYGGCVRRFLFPASLIHAVRQSAFPCKLSRARFADLISLSNLESTLTEIGEIRGIRRHNFL